MCKAESLCYKRTITFFSAISCQYNMHASLYLFLHNVCSFLSVSPYMLACVVQKLNAEQCCFKYNAIFMCCSASSRLLKAGLVGPPPFLSEVKLLRVQQPFNSVISAGLFNKDFSFQHNLQFKIQE